MSAGRLELALATITQSHSRVSLARLFWTATLRPVESSPPPSVSVKRSTSRMLLTILVILLAIALLGGFAGGSRGWGYYGWSPLGLLVLIILILLLTGN